MTSIVDMIGLIFGEKCDELMPTSKSCFLLKSEKVIKFLDLY